MLQLLRFVPWPAWLGVAALIVACVVGFAAYHQSVGAKKVVERDKEQRVKSVEKVRRMNDEIDKDTAEENEDLVRRLREIDDKWLTQRLQDLPPEQPSPASQQQ